MLKRSTTFIALVTLATGPAAATVPTATAPFDLVQSFIRQVGGFEEDRARVANDQAANNEDFAGCVRNMTTFQMDLDVSASYLMAARLSNSNMAHEISPIVSAIVRQKYVIVGDLIKECEAIMAPEPKVDYDELARRAPRIAAMSDYVDKMLFDASPGMFATLINNRANSKNQANHLVITRAQREQLLKTIQNYFGEKLSRSDADANSYVAIAQLFRDKLNEFKCADDPWEQMTSAEHRGKAYHNGRIDLLVLEVHGSATPVFIYRRKGRTSGHENEVLFAAGAQVRIIGSNFVRGDYLVSADGINSKPVPIHVHKALIF